MVKSLLELEIEPGYEETMSEMLSSERQCVEHHLVSYNNTIVAIVDSKDEAQAEDLAQQYRLLRQVRQVGHTYILNEVKSGFGRLPAGANHLTLTFGRIDAGTEEATLETLAAGNARDVLHISGQHDVLITSTSKDVQGVWTAVGKLLKDVRFLSRLRTYVSVDSKARHL